ncbi:MAG: cytochrome c [Bacteroidia bacterium]|nr:cytochrome c [Bacteroidia bacterium]
MKKISLSVTAILAIFLMASCGGENNSSNANASASKEVGSDQTQEASAEETSDKGIGKFTDIKLDPTLNKAFADGGKGIYDMKCGSCHRLTEERLVGPGFKGVTERRKPEWIMNFITNAAEMLDKDPAAIAMLEECLVRMPNQNLSDDDARNVLEFLRMNDGLK